MESHQCTYQLPPFEQAQLAVSSRLISCLVTESLLRAIYIPTNNDVSPNGIMLIISSSAASQHFTSFQTNDVFALVYLRHPPVFKNDETQNNAFVVSLVDPMDMLPEMYEVLERTIIGTDDDAPQETLAHVLSNYLATPSPGYTRIFKKFLHPQDLWKKCVTDMAIQDPLRDAIEAELLSSLHWQTLAFQSPPVCPEISSPSIQWEQSLVAGHPTHPMHRARMTSFSISSVYDWKHPLIRFVAVPRTSLSLLGPFESDMRSLAGLAASRVNKTLPTDASLVIMPVHEIQLPTILKKFVNVHPLDADIAVQAFAQSSTRTVIMPDMPGKALKLAVNVKISSSLRTISHFTANFGPRFSSEIIPKLRINPQILSVECEPASAVYANVDPDIAKHFTAIIRNQFQPSSGENVIVVAALLESGHANIPAGICALQHAFQLDTDTKRVEFVDRYIRIVCEAMIPPLLYNGVAFEAHAQNMVARFDMTTGKLLGFIVRDLGGLRIHPETLAKSTGVEFPFLPGHCVVTGSQEETYPKFYHTLVHNHLQRLIRLMGLHYDGRGYAMLRRHLGAIIPADHGLWKIWLGEEGRLVSGKCLMRMRLQSLYRDMVYSPFPNMIQYRPE